MGIKSRTQSWSVAWFYIIKWLTVIYCCVWGEWMWEVCSKPHWEVAGLKAQVHKFIPVRILSQVSIPERHEWWAGALQTTHISLWMVSLSSHPWGEWALPPCSWHSAGTKAAGCSFSFVKVVAFFASWQKIIPRYIKYVFKKYTFKSKKMQVY